MYFIAFSVISTVNFICGSGFYSTKFRFIEAQILSSQSAFLSALYSHPFWSDAPVGKAKAEGGDGDGGQGGGGPSASRPEDPGQADL